MTRLLRHLFFLLVIRPVVLVALGLNARNRERLPAKGPAIVVANHNSHLDTMVLFTLFPRRLLGRIRPVAAADYFLRNKLLAWFSLNIIGILPLERKVTADVEDMFAGISEALEQGDILLLYPEGSRGEPEQQQAFKKGIARIVERHPEVPVTPVFLHGLGKALPRGEALLVPFFCDVFVGEPLQWSGDRRSFMDALNAGMDELAGEGNFPTWE
jgi:1-acyl-sn-glycerol-3-phosphate acyltransferase